MSNIENTKKESKEKTVLNKYFFWQKVFCRKGSKKPNVSIVILPSDRYHGCSSCSAPSDDEDSDHSHGGGAGCSSCSF